MTLILIIIGTSSVLVYSTLSSRNEDFAQLGLESYVLHARIFSLKIIQLTTSYSSAFTLYDASWIGIHLFTYVIIEFLHPLGFSLTFFMLYILFGFSYLFCLHKLILYNTFFENDSLSFYHFILSQWVYNNPLWKMDFTWWCQQSFLVIDTLALFVDLMPKRSVEYEYS